MSILSRRLYSLHDFVSMLSIMFNYKFNQLINAATLIAPGIEQITGILSKWHFLDNRL